MIHQQFDLNLLVSFRAVAEVCSISKASEVLFLSQPAISLQIKKLEENLGGQLFVRQNRGLMLTPLGNKLLVHVQGLMNSVEKIAKMTGQVGETSGEVRIGTYTTTSSYLLTSVVSELTNKFPKIKLSYEYGATSQILERVKTFKLDCAVMSDAPTDDPNLLVEDFFKDELVFAMAPKMVSRKEAKIYPKEIVQFAYLSYPHRFELCYRLVEKTFGKYIRRCRIPLESESFDTLKQALLAGIGATFIPKYIIKDELNRGELVAVQIEGRRLPLIYSLITRSESELTLAAAEFRSHLLSSFNT